jgi:epoxide hydrolase
MSDDTAIRPFRIAIPQTDLEDLQLRLERTRWPRTRYDGGWGRGIPAGYLEQLTRYWARDFDWHAQEARLNETPQWVTTIDGQDIHFLHVRSSAPGALPLLLTHGWPSSPFEFLTTIGPLSEPAGTAADGFDLVIPALPGYPLSTPVREPGWGNLARVAQAWTTLMDRLGYDRFGVHGTDVGTGVAGMLAMLVPERIVGVHLTGTAAAAPFGPPLTLDGLSGVDRERAERFNRFREDGLGYFHLQSTRPQTIGYLLNDSPAGQLAWIVEKFHEWTDPAAALPDEAVDRDQLLTGVSLYWFTGAGASSAHAGYEGVQAWRQMAAEAGDGDGDWHPGAPMGVAVFAADTTIRSVMDPEGRIEHWSEYDRGGHFPAMEVPELLIADLREFFRQLR